MHTYQGVFTIAGVLALGTGCGDDSSSGGAGETGAGTDGTTGGTVGDGTGTTGDATGGGSDSASGTGTGSTGAGPTEVFIGGEVRDFWIDMPIAGAEISLWELPGFETVSDDMGLYQIDGLMPNTETAAILAPNDVYLGGIIPVSVPAEDNDKLQLTQISREFIADQEGLLADEMPEPTDPNLAIVVVRLIQNTATGAMVEMDPAPLPGTYYAPNADGAPRLNLQTVEFGLLPVVVYFNVAPAGPGAYAFTVTHPERECTIRHPSFPTLAGHVTQVEVDCPPPM